MPKHREDPESHYRRFIEQVLTSGEVWGLHSESGWAFCESNEYEDTDVLVFWSDRADAQKHALGEWSNFQPTAIPLDEFTDQWLAGMDEDGALVGPNWDADLNGLEVEPADLAEQLTADDSE
jgi:hypothetical protein